MKPSQFDISPLSDGSSVTVLEGKSLVQRTTSSIASTSTSTQLTADDEEEWTAAVSEYDVSGVYANATQKLFPYHVVVNRDFRIMTTGEGLSRVLDVSKEELIGQRLHEILSISKPCGAEWSWEWLCRQGEQSFYVEPSFGTADLKELRFRATSVHISKDRPEAMINMIPDAHTVDELLEMDLTMQDMPVHGAYREALDLQEKLNYERNNTGKSSGAGRLELVQAKKALSREQELLESLVPKHVAEGLRSGENVAPRVHENVTFFFSDVVNFTDMCKQLYPWQVIGMLNRLYCVMDYLADKFDLFKVETIGDAYVCCSGLPDSDEDHAEKVANFAIAVNHCARHVFSPVDGTSIQLRIGIHSGSAASGVVGVTNPRYCVFGDTVNVTARHESSGVAGRVHCSAVTQQTLEKSGASENFKLIERGLVDLKGKGKLKTFWLEAGESNEFINEEGMAQLSMETQSLLQQTKFESKLERENSERSMRLKGQLEQASFNGKNKEVMGPILDIIRRELSSKSLSGSRHNTPQMTSRQRFNNPANLARKHFGSSPANMNRNHSSNEGLGGSSHSAMSSQRNAEWSQTRKARTVHRSLFASSFGPPPPPSQSLYTRSPAKGCPSPPPPGSP